MTPEIPFRRGAVEPVECIKGGWEMIKNQYWLFVAMALVAILIGSAVPLGILLGPMMCGLYLTFFKARRGEPVEFSMMFKGFDYFGPSLIATLLHIIPIIAIVLPAYLLFYVSIFVSMAAQGSNGEPNPAALFGVMATFGIFWIVVLIVVVIISVGFTFAYPLIVDRKLLSPAGNDTAYFVDEYCRRAGLLRGYVSGYAHRLRRHREGLRAGVWTRGWN
jgi:hypothetical protein